jgi:hypothetical protein
MFAALFLLIIGAVMVGGTVRGIRRGRVMTLIKSSEQNHDLFVRPGESGFWFFAACWMVGGTVVFYHGVRLMWLT